MPINSTAENLVDFYLSYPWREDRRRNLDHTGLLISFLKGLRKEVKLYLIARLH